MYRHFGKRLFDLLIAATALLLLAPLFIVVALLVRVKLGTPVIFRQLRPGHYGRPFTLLKFRTMTDARDVEGNLLPDSIRLTKFGRFLRSTSLDELPELANVLKGEMSLVGPRPLLMHYLALYSPDEMRRHEVKPGITGLAQVKGRNELTWSEKFSLDLHYVDNYSFWLDTTIMARTVLKVVRRDGISQPGQATIEEFRGNPELQAE